MTAMRRRVVKGREALLRERLGVFLLFTLSVSLPIHAQTIATVAGGASLDGRPGTASRLYEPEAVVADNAGNVFIGDAYRVWRLDGATGLLTVYAGNGARASSGDGGLAISASMEPKSLDLDPSGNLYVLDVADQAAAVVRRIDARTGIISRVAGGGGATSDGGLATGFRIDFPNDIALDDRGNLYIADAGGVRKVDAVSQRITIAAGRIGGSIDDIGDGGPATATRIDHPESVVVDDARSILYLCANANTRVRAVNLATGIITTIAGGGELDVKDGLPATQVRLVSVNDLAVDTAGNILFADFFSIVRKVDRSTGQISNVAGTFSGFGGDGGPATAARLNGPESLSIGADGALHIADTRNARTRKIDASGTISTTAGIGSDGNPFVGDGSPATAATLSLTRFVGERFHAVRLDREGNLYIADQGNYRIRRVDAKSGLISTIVGNGNRGTVSVGVTPTTTMMFEPSGIAFDSGGVLHFADGSTVYRIDGGSGRTATVAGGGSTKGDGGPASAAFLNAPVGIAFDSADNLFIVDRLDHRVRRVDATTRVITTVAGDGDPGVGKPLGDDGPATQAHLFWPNDIAIDATGNLFISDGVHNSVRRVDATSGVITRYAGNGEPYYSGDGGPATLAAMDNPAGLAFDGAGNLIIAVRDGNRVRRVSAATGVITTVAGVETGFAPAPVYGGDDGPATRARLAWPEGIVVDNRGNIIFADANSNRVRMIFACVTVAAPQLTSPSAGSSGVSTSAALRWSPVDGAFRYDVLLDSVTPPLAVAVADVTSTSVTIPNLPPLTTLHWQVVAKGDPYCTPRSTASSEVRSFTTTTECSRPAEFQGALP